MPSIQEQQAPIDKAIVNAMIESTPESWDVIVLTLSRAPVTQEQNFVGSFLHELTSPQDTRPCGPCDSLFEATFRLDQLLRSNGSVLRSAVYKATNNGTEWSFDAEFKYEPR